MRTATRSRRLPARAGSRSRGSPACGTTERSGGFEEQATLAWQNVCDALSAAGFEVQDLVKITQYLTSADDIPTHAAIRARFLGGARPASMLVVVPALLWPQMSIEIDAWAAHAP